MTSIANLNILRNKKRDKIKIQTISLYTSNAKVSFFYNDTIYYSNAFQEDNMYPRAGPQYKSRSIRTRIAVNLPFNDNNYP